MNPETYFKIMILALGRESLVTAFTVLDLFTNKQVLVNGVAQFAGYVGTNAIGNHMTPEIMLPILTNTKLAVKFLQLPGTSSVPERVATLAFTFGAGATVTKVGDIPTNFALGATITALSQYMQSCVDNGSVPFAYIRSRRVNLSIKQHAQMQFLIFDSLIIIVCSIGAYIYLNRYCFKLGKSLKYRLSRRRSVKVKFIPIH